jgi:RsiW-degrading membrane proteinase PrsW (M82 family)
VHFINTGFRRTAAISIAAFLKRMKKSITILFVLATVAFCVLLYWLLFYADHHGKTIWIVIISAGLVVISALLVWLYNRYFSIAINKRGAKKTQVSSH